MTWRVESTAPFTGIHNAYLDKLINEGASTTNYDARLSVYKQIYKYMSDQALMPFLYAGPLYDISNKDVHGPGVSTANYNNHLLEWPDLWKS
jgi:ABC-type transport system substrate-binding protein